MATEADPVTPSPIMPVKEDGTPGVSSIVAPAPPPPPRRASTYRSNSESSCCRGAPSRGRRGGRPKAISRSCRRRCARGENKRRWPTLKRGAKTKLEPELRPLRQAALKLLQKPSLAAIAAASLDELAVAETMLQRVVHEDSLSPLVVVEHSLADGVDVKIRSLDFQLSAPPAGWMDEVYVVAAEGCPERTEASWLPLRHAVCAADEASYEEARQRAREQWDELPYYAQSRIAYAFPDEPWADEVLRALLTDPAGRPLAHGFLLTVCADPDAVRQLAALPHGAQQVAYAALDLVPALEERDVIAIMVEVLPPLLVKPSYGPLLKTPPRRVAAAIGCFRTAEAARVLAGYAGHRVLAALVAAYFQDAPVELVNVLAEEATSKAAKQLAADLQAAHAAREDDSPEAAAAAVPAILRTHAWRPPKKKRRVRVVAGVTLPDDVAERVELPPHVPKVADRFPVRDMSDKELADWRAEGAEGRWVGADYEHSYRGKRHEFVRVPPEEGLSAWNRGRAYVQSELELLATHGLAALPGFVGPDRDWVRVLDWEGTVERLDVLARLITPRVAPAWAQVAGCRKKHRRQALGWLGDHPSLAAQGLIPLAVGPRGKARDEAEAALLHLLREGHAEVIRSAAASYGAAVVEVIDELLARDPLVVERKPPKPPALLRIADLPPLRLRDGARLPAAAREALVELLSVAAADGHYPGFEAITSACDEASLSAFVVAVVEQWVRGDAPGRADWMIHAAVVLPSDAATRRVAELAREWARSSQAKALRACAALAMIGDDHALLHLGHIAATTRFAKLRAEAQELLDEIAARRGLTRDELEDRSVPDLGLDPDGSLPLSFGARTFRISLDESLSVVVRDSAGQRLRTLPRGQKTDDGAAVKQAKARFAALKKGAKQIAERQIRRFEAAMVCGRSWPYEEARARIFTHPLARHLARGLVWRTSDGSLAFRVAEDGTLADIHDDEVSVPAGAPMQIAHPVQLGPDTQQWAELLADYDLLQPFEQLDRTVHRPTPKEAKAKQVRHAEGVKLPAVKLLGLLEARRWERDSPGHVSVFVRSARGIDGGELELHIPVSPGIEIAYLEDSLQTVGAATVQVEGRPIAVRRLDPVAYSELVRDLEALRSR